MNRREKLSTLVKLPSNLQERPVLAAHPAPAAHPRHRPIPRGYSYRRTRVVITSSPTP